MKGIPTSMLHPGWCNEVRMLPTNFPGSHMGLEAKSMTPFSDLQGAKIAKGKFGWCCAIPYWTSCLQWAISIALALRWEWEQSASHLIKWDPLPMPIVTWRTSVRVMVVMTGGWTAPWIRHPSDPLQFAVDAGCIRWFHRCLDYSWLVVSHLGLWNFAP